MLLPFWRVHMRSVTSGEVAGVVDGDSVVVELPVVLLAVVAVVARSKVPKNIPRAASERSPLSQKSSAASSENV